VVHRAVCYARYDTLERLPLLNKLYSVLRLYTNFFQLVMKLIAKERSGAKVKKTYDKPPTPCRRVLSSSAVDEDAKEALRAQYEKLNPGELKRQISRLQDRLLKTAAHARIQTANDAPRTANLAGSFRLDFCVSRKNAATRSWAATTSDDTMRTSYARD
jgi:hypothetical protein